MEKAKIDWIYPFNFFVLFSAVFNRIMKIIKTDLKFWMKNKISNNISGISRSKIWKGCNNCFNQPLKLAYLSWYTYMRLLPRLSPTGVHLSPAWSQLCPCNTGARFHRFTCIPLWTKWNLTWVCDVMCVWLDVLTFIFLLYIWTWSGAPLRF